MPFCFNLTEETDIKVKWFCVVGREPNWTILQNKTRPRIAEVDLEKSPKSTGSKMQSNVSCCADDLEVFFVSLRVNFSLIRKSRDAELNKCAVIPNEACSICSCTELEALL